MNFIQCIFDFFGKNASALIALSALGLATWQGISQRRHNRLSVKPHLIFDTLLNNQSPQLKVLLLNTGVGPAIITRFDIYFDGNKVDFPVETTWTKIAEQFNIPVPWGGGKIFYIGEAIQAGGKERIFVIKTTKEEEDPNFNSELAQNELKRIQIEIKYESVYGDKFNEIYNKT